MTTETADTAPVTQGKKASDLTAQRSSDGDPVSRTSWFRSPEGILAAVAVTYAVACVALVPRTIGLSWDEIVYTSQLGIDQVPMPWGGHRAWGSVVLVAPVVVFTKSVTVLRTYLVVVAGLAMFAAFRPWLSIFGRNGWIRYTAPLAAVLFGTGWFAIYYGSKAYPNLWLAFALVAGIGYFLVAARQPASIAPLVGAFSTFAVAAVFRPTDTIAAAFPLLLTMLVPRWRAPRAVAAALAGVAAGTAPWVIEALLRFGGPVERLRDSADAANTGIHFRLIEQLHATDGPYLLCSPTLCNGISIGMEVWWIGQLLLAIAGVVAALRTKAFLPTVLTLACALAFAGPYFTVVGGSHPRFLIPAYALLSVGSAYAVLWLLGRLGGRARWLAAVVVVAGVVAQAAVHHETLLRVLAIQVRISDETRVRAAALTEQGKVVAPCLLYGQYTVGLSYYPGCDGVQTNTPPGPANKVIQRALADGQRVVLIYNEDTALPEPHAGWQRLQLPGGGVDAFLSPR